MHRLFERERAPGSDALHALIVGISNYPHLPVDPPTGRPEEPTLGLRKLESPALTGLRIARWLISRADRLIAPLSTCSVLLLPSEAEIEIEPDLRRLVDVCTHDAFSTAVAEWRRDADSNLGDVTLFYFAGHGV
jgi:hypothetical protein